MSRMADSPFNDLAGPWTGAVISKNLQTQIFKAAVAKRMFGEDSPQVGDVGYLKEEVALVISVRNFLQLWPIIDLTASSLKLCCGRELERKSNLKLNSLK